MSDYTPVQLSVIIYEHAIQHISEGMMSVFMVVQAVGMA